jgi:hypothetical protein
MGFFDIDKLLDISGGSANAGSGGGGTATWSGSSCAPRRKTPTSKRNCGNTKAAT